VQGNVADASFALAADGDAGAACLSDDVPDDDIARRDAERPTRVGFPIRPTGLQRHPIVATIVVKILDQRIVRAVDIHTVVVLARARGEHCQITRDQRRT
jgi:hypothetical protein